MNEYPDDIRKYVDTKFEQQEKALLVTERQLGDILINLIVQNTILVIRANEVSISEELYKNLFDDACESKKELSKSNIPYYVVGTFRNRCEKFMSKLGIIGDGFPSPF
jgi:hypothetical protein